MGESRNLTCDAVQDPVFTTEFDDALEDNDPQETLASNPEQTPTRGQTLLGFAGLLFIIWFVATQWLPQHNALRLTTVSLFFPMLYLQWECLTLSFGSFMMLKDGLSLMTWLQGKELNTYQR